MLAPATCNRTGRVVDLGTVEVIARYADCSVFDCPACGARAVDDREGVHFTRVMPRYGRTRCPNGQHLGGTMDTSA